MRVESLSTTGVIYKRTAALTSMHRRRYSENNMDPTSNVHTEGAHPEHGVRPEAVARKLKFDYSYGPRDQADRTLEALQSFFKRARDPSADLRKLLQDVADLIYRQFRIREVSIGLRDPSDGLYRYQVVHTVREGIRMAHTDLAYRYEDFFDESKWKGTVISNYTKLMLAEWNPYEPGEEETYDRELMLKSKRRSEEDSIEGDYLDILIRGVNDDLLGWIEISGTWDMKIPNAKTIRSIEIIASALGLVLSTTSLFDQLGSVGRKPTRDRTLPQLGEQQKHKR